jgi:aspartyl/asparaginyl beta-hydroxylase (cupin superfamily)
MSNVEPWMQPWIDAVADRQRLTLARTGRAKLAFGQAAAAVLSAPRRLTARGRFAPAPPLQMPWFPVWPGLASKPVHDPKDFAWTEVLRQAHADIRDEMLAVRERFGHAMYGSGAKPWTTYYFYLKGRTFEDHLKECPRTAAALAELPLTRGHVCYAAIEPGGGLDPHVGPTNTSLTFHLGLANCAGARLFIADQVLDYRDGELIGFDDTFLHWVEHTGTETRYTLMVTVWHPDLSALERGFLRAVTTKVSP